MAKQNNSTSSGSGRKQAATRKNTAARSSVAKTASFKSSGKHRFGKKSLLAFLVVFAAIGLAFTFLSHAAIPAYTPVYFIKTKNTPGCHVEVHRVTAASDYKTVDIASQTWFSCNDADNGTWQMVNGDLWFIKTKNTAGTIEVHSATRDSNYKSGIHSTTAIGVADGANGTFQMVGNELYFIKTKNTAGTIEVHAVSRQSNFQQFSVHSTTAYNMADADNGVWRMYKTDLAFVKTKNTGSGKVELHIATRGSNYQKFGLHTASFFRLDDVVNGTFWVVDANDDGSPDLGFVKKQNTGTGKVEAFFAEAPKYDTLAVAQPTWFSPVDANNGTWYMDSQVLNKPAPPSPASPTSTAKPGGGGGAPKKATYTCVGTTTKEVDSRDICIATLTYGYGGNQEIIARQLAASDLANAGGPATFTPVPIVSGPPTLQLGASGSAVSDLQQRLAGRGFWIAASGNYDGGTETTVRWFQTGRGITSDGVVGAQTWDQLEAAEREGWRFNANPNPTPNPGPTSTTPTTTTPTTPVDPNPIETYFEALRQAGTIGQCTVYFVNNQVAGTAPDLFRQDCINRANPLYHEYVVWRGDVVWQRAGSTNQGLCEVYGIGPEFKRLDLTENGITKAACTQKGVFGYSPYRKDHIDWTSATEGRWQVFPTTFKR